MTLDPQPDFAASSAAGAIIVEGPRGCGKTESSSRASRSAVRLDSPVAQRILDIDPASLLDGATPRLLDEWQQAPVLWNLVRREVDSRRSVGQFILTGSAVPADDITRHTRAARFLRLRMRTMTQAEKLDSPDSAADTRARPLEQPLSSRYHQLLFQLR